MKIEAISIKGKVTELEISEKIFSSDIKDRILSHVLYSQISNLKRRLAKTKQRNEVVGSTAKIYAQKGTGNARHSSRKAPIFVGGGIAHGPKGDVYKVRKINRKEKKKSLIVAISQKYHISRIKLSLKNNGYKNIYTHYPNYYEIRDIYSIIRELPAWMKYYILKL